jgi:hypothetical protein
MRKREKGGGRGAVAGLCRRCLGNGMHYLTCATLRVPPGYRLADDPGLIPEHRPWSRARRAAAAARLTLSG